MNQFPMSSFTIGLAIIGAVLLAVLVAWNAWISRRNTPRQAQPAPPATGPTAAEGESGRSEPTFDSDLA
ncbi:MAG: hypothetical protein JWR22_2811, partial [Herminiimonas sp.]|nr:hypothetical protein [Herminiimonas sp.]